MPSKTSQPTQERNKFNKQGTSAESCALDSERHKGMGVGQSGNTLWRKYIFSRGLKEVKWRIYTEEKERRPALQKGKQQEQSPRAAVLNLFLSHGTHKLITKILQHTRKYTFCRSDKKKKRYNSDSFTPCGYCCVGGCHFFIWQSKGKEVIAPD